MNPVYVAFHTGGDYERHAAELIETLDRLDLAHAVWQLPDAGSWVRCCAMKPTFIRQCMEQFPGQPIVYLDADARVRQRPELFYSMTPGTDFACHYLDGKELLSGTLYFGGTVASVELVEAWQARCRDMPDVWDQQHLQSVVHHGTFNVAYLPETYCRIYDRQKRMPREAIVIEHLQESRNQKAKGR